MFVDACGFCGRGPAASSSHCAATQTARGLAPLLPLQVFSIGCLECDFCDFEVSYGVGVPSDQYHTCLTLLGRIPMGTSKCLAQVEPVEPVISPPSTDSPDSPESPDSPDSMGPDSPSSASPGKGLLCRAHRSTWFSRIRQSGIVVRNTFIDIRDEFASGLPEIVPVDVCSCL